MFFSTEYIIKKLRNRSDGLFSRTAAWTPAWKVPWRDQSFVFFLKEDMRYLCYTEQGTLNSYTAEELLKEFYDPKGVQEVVEKYCTVRAVS